MIIFIGILAGKTVWSTAVTVWSGVGLPVWCSYGGVTCDSVVASQTYGRIISIDFSLAYIIGSLPSSIGNLKVMKILNLHNNQIGNTIPSSIGDLTALTYLDLRTNSLIGPIPSSIGGLSSATFLSLGQNLIYSTIPSSLNTLTNLKSLFLDNNFFDGSIPSLAALQLDNLYLYLNYLRPGDSPVVSPTTFSTYTLQKDFKVWGNCFEFHYAAIDIFPTRCLNPGG